MLRKEQKGNIIENNRLHEKDTGSPEVQIAILTSRIIQVFPVSTLRGRPAKVVSKIL